MPELRLSEGVVSGSSAIRRDHRALHTPGVVSIKGLSNTRRFGYSREDRLFLEPHLPPTKPSATHAVMNRNKPKIQQNTPKVHIKPRYVPGSACVRCKTLKAHALQREAPKEIDGTSGIPKSFEAVLRHKLESIVRAESWASIAVSRVESSL